jgi:hypothetical protein
MDLNFINDKALEKLKEQDCQLVSTPEKLQELISFVQKEYDQWIPREVQKGGLPLCDRSIAAALFGYNFVKQHSTNCSSILNFGDTEVHVTIDQYKYLTLAYDSFDELRQDNPFMQYMNGFLKKDDGGTVLILKANEEYRAGLFFYTGCELAFREQWDIAVQEAEENNLSMSDVISSSEITEELRAKLLELRPDALTEALSKVDTFVDEKDPAYLVGTTGGMNIGVYDLFKGQINGVDVTYIRCYCPSTDRMFLLGAENIYTTAKDAIGSLCRVPRKLRDSIRYIQRQGEVFSLVLDDETTQMVEAGVYTKEELNDLVPMSGEEYFSKMRYEY